MQDFYRRQQAELEANEEQRRWPQMPAYERQGEAQKTENKTAEKEQ